MLSRVADTIYWMARYMERTHGMLQILRTNYILSQDEDSEVNWQLLLNTFGSKRSKSENIEIGKDTAAVFVYLVSDRANAASAFNNIMQARENARAIQDHITKEVWQCVNNYYHCIREPGIEKQLRNGDPVTAIDLLIRNGFLFTGTIKNTMTRDEGYTFLHLGKFLERAIITVDILRIKLSEIDRENAESSNARGLRYLLYSLYGYEIYVKTYKGIFSLDQAIELVVYNPFFPHSIMYSLNQLNKYFERLKPESLTENYDLLEFSIGKTLNNVKYSNAEAKNLKMLNQFLLQTRKELIEIGNSFSRYYFGNT